MKAEVTKVEHPGALRLETSALVSTAGELGERVNSLFPGRGITRLTGSLSEIIDESIVRTERMARPMWWLRGILVVLGAAAVYAVASALLAVSNHDWHRALVSVNSSGAAGWASLIQFIIQDLVFVGIAVLFVVRIEQHLKRRRALSGLRKLRSLVHVIEMHQLIKEPASLQGAGARAGRKVGGSKQADPVTYFACCSTMAALCSKTAALYAQNSNDSVVLDVVREIEALAAALSSKLWQKIMVSTRA